MILSGSLNSPLGISRKFHKNSEIWKYKEVRGKERERKVFVPGGVLSSPSLSSHLLFLVGKHSHLHRIILLYLRCIYISSKTGTQVEVVSRMKKPHNHVVYLNSQKEPDLPFLFASIASASSAMVIIAYLKEKAKSRKKR